MNFLNSSITNKSYSSLISSYYASEIMPNYSKIIRNNISNFKLTKLPKEFLNENDEEDDISKQIENTLRQKYNFVIPAIEININENAKIELIKEDLNKFFELFGEIEFINITSNSNKVYILYKYYFSAMYAFYAMNDIISGKLNNENKNENNLIKVNMFDDSKKRPQKNCANDSLSNNLLENSKTPIKLNNINNINNNNNKKILENNQNIFPNQNNGILLNNNYNNNNDNNDNINKIKNSINNNNQNINLNNVQKSLLLNQPSFIPFKEKFQLLQKQMLETREKILKQQIQIQKQQILNQQQIFQRHKLLQQQIIMKNQINEKISNNYIPNIDFEKMTLQMKNDIKFNTYSNREYMYKYVCNYNIQIENDESFNVTKRIIGKNGYFLKKIIYEGCIKFNDYSTKIRLRGKGSGYKEGNLNIESNEPLELCISSLNYPTYINCCRLVESLLKKIYFDYYQFRKSITPISLVDAIKQKQIIKYEYVVNRFGNNDNILNEEIKNDNNFENNQIQTN